jgi:hypothetical protein
MFDRLLKRNNNFSELLKKTIEKDLARLLIFSKEQENKEFFEMLISHCKIDENYLIEASKFYDAKYIKEESNFEPYKLKKIIDFYEKSEKSDPLKQFINQGNKENFQNFLDEEIQKGTTSNEILMFLKKSARIGL